MLAQYAHCAGQWRIEIDMQIADEVVGHGVNLYSLDLRVKGMDCELLLL